MDNAITGYLQFGQGFVYGTGLAGVSMTGGVQYDLSIGPKGVSTGWGESTLVQGTALVSFQGGAEAVGGALGPVSADGAVGYGFAIGERNGLSGFVGAGYNTDQGWGIYGNFTLVYGATGAEPLFAPSLAGGLYLPLNPAVDVGRGMYGAVSSVWGSPSSWDVTPLGDPAALRTPDPQVPEIPYLDQTQQYYDMLSQTREQSWQPEIPYLQQSQEFSELYASYQLTQSIEQMVAFSGEVNQAISTYANNLSNPTQNGAGDGSTKLTFDDGYGNRVSDATGWQVTADDFASLNEGVGGTSWGGSSGWSGGSSGWSGGWSGGSSGGSWGGSPVVLDLTGQGIHVAPRTSSNQYFDMAGDGYQHATAWAGAGNGVLVLDLNNSGVINQANQVDFRLWDSTAKSDMQALLDVFDTNHNGKLDAGDGNWSKFKILVTNADGTTQLQTLAELGIVSIDLTTNNQSIALPDGSSIKGQTTYTKSDGTTGIAADVTFAYDPNGYVVQSTVTHNADGSTTIDNKAFGASGNLAEETIRKASADGKTITLSRDANGDGIVDSIENDVTVTNADGSTTLTISNFDAGGGHLVSRSVTTTSADRKVVTTNRDSTGSGTFNQVEIDSTDAAGALAVTITDLNPDGSTRDRVVTVTGASGLSRTTQSDSAGSGHFDLTVVDDTVINANGSRTETVSSFNEDDSLRGRVVTSTSADHLTKTTQYDSSGNGVFDRTDVETVAVGGDGSVSTVQQEYNADGSTRSKVVTALSADGLSRTTQTDLNGDGIFELTKFDVTVVNADGSRTETVTDRNADNSVRDRSVTTRSADGRNRTISVDTNGEGGFESVEIIGSGANNSIVDTLERRSRNGTLLSRSVTTTSSDGLTIVSESDVTGDGIADRTRTDVTTANADGGRTQTITDKSVNGALLSKLVVTTSADGLSKETKSDSTGANSFDLVRNDVTVINSDGSTVETVLDKNADGTTRSKTVATISANRAVSTLQVDSDGDGHWDSVQTRTLNASGSVDLTVASYAANGVLTGSATTTTSANGLTITSQQDLSGTGNGAFDLGRADVTVLNADGSLTQTISDSSRNGNLIHRTRTTTSAAGLSVEVQTDADGVGGYDHTKTDLVTIGADGSRTETISNRGGDGTLLGRSVMTTSASGLSVTIQSDTVGSGGFDQVSTDVTALNADGSRTETISMFAADGSLTGRAVVTTSADRATVTTWRDRDGDGVFEQKEVDAVAADGSTVRTLSDYTPAGVPTDSTVITASANGLSVKTQYDSNGDGNVDKLRTDVTILNVDGSRTETITETDVNNHLIDRAVIDTSANGLVKVTQEDVTGSGSFSLKETDITTLGSDGSRVRVVTATNASGGILRKTTTTISGDGKTQGISRDVDGNGFVDQAVTTTIAVDGSKISTLTDYTSSGVLKDKAVVTTSANGLSVKTERDTTGAGSVNQTTTDVTVLNVDGSRTETITNSSGSTIKDRTVIATSANGLSKTTTWDLNGDGAGDETQTDVTSLNADGSRTRTVSIYTGGPTGPLKGRSVETTSGNGLVKTTQWTAADGSSQTLTDVISLNADGSRTETATAALESKVVTTISANGQQKVVRYDNNLDGFVDKTQTITTSGNADGSLLETVTDYDGNGSLSDRSVRTTSADGRTVTIVRDVDGDGVTDQTEVDVTAIDGSKISTLTDLGPAAAVLGKTIVSTSADGLTTTTQWQFNGGGVVNRTRTDTITKNADGSTSETVVDRNSDGTVYQQGITTTSADDRTKTLQQQAPGKTYFNHIETTVINADGSSTTIAKDKTSTGDLADQKNTTISADGLVKKVDEDTTGSGSFDYHATTTRRIDGSSITDATSFDASAQTTKHVVTTTSADGLTEVIQTDTTNDGTFDSIETIVTRIDGSTISTKLDQSSGNSKTVTETSANQANKVAYTLNQDGSYTISIWSADQSQAWSFLSNSYDSAGRLLTQKGTYTNGQSWETKYDRSGSETWAMQTHSFNADGQAVSGYIENDDGTFARQYFNTAGTVNWSRIENIYSAQGVLLEQHGVFRDNAVTNAPAVFFQEGGLTLNAPSFTVGYGHGSTWTNQYYQQVADITYHFSFINLADDATLGFPIAYDGDQSILARIFVSYPGATPGYSSATITNSPFNSLVYAGYTNLNDVVDSLGSLFDFEELGVVSRASSWTFLPGNAAFPTSGAALLDLIDKTIADAGTVGTLGNDTLTGTAGADRLSAFAGNDSLYGQAGDDTLDGGSGADTLVGGAGNDVYVVDNAGDVVTENVNDGVDTVRSSINYTLGANVENLVLTGGAAISATGNASANLVTGNDGDNLLSGLGGNDTIDGAGGTDVAVFSGNRASYAIAYSATTKAFTVSDLRAGSPDGVDTVRNVEIFQFSDGQAKFDTLGRLYDWTVANADGTRTETVYDVAGSQVWSSKVLIFSGAGALLSSTENGRDGTSRVTLFDADGTFSWSSETAVYGSSNRLVSLSVTLDDQSSIVSQFDSTDTSAWSTQTGAGGAGTQSIVISDPADAFTWSSYVNVVDGGGRLVSQSGTLDNGGHWLNRYDAVGAATWAAYYNAYDANGNATWQSATQHDGTHWLTLFDPSNSYSWSQATMVFDANWNMLALTGTTDDGSHIVNRDEFLAAYDTVAWTIGAYVPSQHQWPQPQIWGGTVAENAVPGAIVGTVAGAPGDGGTIINFAMTDSAGGKFAIDVATGIVTVAPGAQFDYEAVPSLTIGVRTTDADGTISDKVFTITVTNVNEAPTGATLTGGSVTENAADGTVVGTVAGTDPDASSSFTYSLIDSANGRFAVNASTGIVTVANGALLDFETAASHNISVRVTDQGGLTFDRSFTITVANANDAPSGATLSANTVAENASNGTVVGTVSGIDADAGGTLSYALTNTASGRFAINAATGVITVANGTLLDFETGPSQAVTVRVTDQGGLTYDKNFTINVTNVNEAPTGAIMTGGTVAENAVNGTVVGTISGVDPEPSSTFTYALTNNAGGRFAINASTGVVTVANSALLDYETGGTQTITARVTDQGGLSYDKSFTVNLTNVNEAPTNITLSNSTVMEHVPSETVVGVLAGVDPDAGSILSYTLIDNAGGLFKIDPGSNILKTAGSWQSLDYATATSKNVTVKVTDQGGLNFTRSLTIAIAPDHTTVTNGDGSTTTVIYDAPNLYSWNSFRTEANAQGAPTYQIGTTDGGGTWQNEYDASNTQIWSTRMTVTNAAHQIVSQTTVNDNSTLVLVANDVSNSYTWSTFTMQYTWDAVTGWNYSSTSGVNDNGTTALDMNQVWNSFDTLLWYSSPYVVTQGSLGGGDDGLPVILDLDGNGVDVTPLGSSSAFYNMDGGLGRVHTAWVGGNDGLLAIDLAANGGTGPDEVIDQAKEIAFSAWAPGSTSDMAALRQVFDTNRDGELSAVDERWAEFRIWQDSNGDGISQFEEVHQLSDFGICSISLNPTGNPSVLSDGSVIQGLSNYTRTDGTTGLAGDVGLAIDPGWRLPDQFCQLVQAMAAYSDDRGFLAGSELLSSQQDPAGQGMLAATWRPTAAA